MKKLTLFLFQLAFLIGFFFFLFSAVDLVDAKHMKLDKTPFLNLPSTSSVMALALIFMILSLLAFFVTSGANSASNELEEDYDRLTQ